MRKIYSLLLMSFALFFAKAQIAYDFAATSGTFTELVGGTSPAFTACTGYDATDEGYANSLPIGFTFNYNGNNYTTFHMNSNGFIGLDAPFTDGDVYWRNSTGLTSGPLNGSANDKTSSRPLISPLWDDMDMAATTNMTFSTTGTAGNRVLTIQWKDVKWRYTAADASVSFQVKIYESNGKIEFIYRSEAGAAATPTASVGISATATGADNFISVSALTTAATVSKTVEANTISTKPATGLTFTFTPGALPAQDVQVQGWLNVPPTGCHTTPQSVTVRIKNAGSADINASAVSLNLTSTGANSGINLTSTNSGIIAVGATTDITFTGLNLNTTGASVLRAVATLALDPARLNDTGRITVNTATITSTFPVSEGAETSPFKFGWLRSIAGSNAWGLEKDGYVNPDLATPASGDSLYPQDGSFYFLFNSWSAPLGTRSVLHSDCFIMPALTPGREHDINFWMSHDTSFVNDRDSIYVVVSTDRGQTWNRIQGFARYNATFTVPDWKNETVLLSAYAGQTIMIGFEGVSKFGNVMGLDNIVVKANLTLPVTLTSFTGKKEGRNNILSWSTANELNNKGFEILRSADGKNFSSIGFEASKNNTTTAATNYNFVDEKVLSGTNYYQLKQVDKDGKTSLSNIVVLKSNTNKLEISTVYPNPANDKLNAIISSDKEEKVTVSITDLAGKVVSSQQVVTSNGSTNVFFNLQSLSKGTYLLRLTSTKNNEIQIEKFVKQ
jgi:hypothetical protein